LDFSLVTFKFALQRSWERPCHLINAAVAVAQHSWRDNADETVRFQARPISSGRFFWNSKDDFRERGPFGIGTHCSIRSGAVARTATETCPQIYPEMKRTARRFARWVCVGHRDENAGLGLQPRMEDVLSTKKPTFEGGWKARLVLNGHVRGGWGRPNVLESCRFRAPCYKRLAL
jgi:hypothetical protein